MDHAKLALTYYFDTQEELNAFTANAGASAASGKGKAGRPAKKDEKKNEESDDLDGLGDDLDGLGDDDLELEKEEAADEASLENIRKMVAAKAMDLKKKAAIKALLAKVGVDSATKIPAAKYKPFYEKLKAI